MRAFAQVDVFTVCPGLGNPVAVVLDARGLSTKAMQSFANWTNLSETTFVFPPSSAPADYRLRIFTPDHELPFAGHPTIGSAWALRTAGRLAGRASWIQECGAGLVQLRCDGDKAISFAAPPAVVTASPVPAATAGRLLGGPAPADLMMVEVGPRWITGRLDAAALNALRPDGTEFVRAAGLTAASGMTVYAVDDAQQVHVRSFFTAAGMLVEDPVCGSGNVAVAVHLMKTGRTADVPMQYQARQGRHRGRDGRISVTLGDPIWVGGHAVTVISGTVSISG